MGRRVANAVWQRLVMADYPRVGHAGGGNYSAAQHAAKAVNADDCAVYFAGWRRTRDAA